MDEVIVYEEREYHRIDKYPGYYVARNGNIYSSKSKRLIKRRVWRWPHYEVTLIRHEGKSKLISIHRSVAIKFIPNPENKTQVNHIDGNKLNNNDWNLEWNTHQENIRHSYDTGLRENQLKNMREGPGCMLGKSHSTATKKVMSEKKIGDKHPKFKGLYHTPVGIFESSYAVANVLGCDKRIVLYRCKSKSKKFKDWYIDSTNIKIV